LTAVTRLRQRGKISQAYRQSAPLDERLFGQVLNRRAARRRTPGHSGEDDGVHRIVASLHALPAAAVIC
jgi:hypothetical protein